MNTNNSPSKQVRLYDMLALGFNNPDYRRLWVSGFFHSMGMAGEQVIIGFLIYRYTGSTAWVGVSLACYYAPMLFLGVPAGALADQFDRRFLLPIIEGGITIFLLAFGGLFFLSDIEVWALLILTFASGCFRAVYNPIRSSYVYDIVGRKAVVSSLGLINVGTRAGQLLGALSAGTIMHYFGPGFAFLTLGIGHFIGFFGLTRLVTIGRSGEAEPISIRQNLAEYWGEITHNRTLMILIIYTAAIEIFGFSFATALPELAALKFDLGAQGLGDMYTARAIGGVAAAVLLTGMLDLRHKALIYSTIALIFGVALVILGWASHFWIALLAIIVIAGACIATSVLSQGMMQMVVPDKLRGRAMGIWVFAIGTAPFGHLATGLLADYIGADMTLMLNGLVLIIISIVLGIALTKRIDQAA